MGAWFSSSAFWPQLIPLRLPEAAGTYGAPIHGWRRRRSGGRLAVLVHCHVQVGLLRVEVRWRRVGNLRRLVAHLSRTLDDYLAQKVMGAGRGGRRQADRA